MLGITRRTMAVASIATILTAGGVSVAGAATHHGSKSTASSTPTKMTTHRSAKKSTKKSTTSKSGRDERESKALRLSERREERRESAKTKLREHEPAADKVSSVKSAKKGA